MSSKEDVVNTLKQVLADTYALYLKTQNYHWNVEGPNFRSLHKMFEEQYTELAEAVDETAERIRSLGEKAIGSFQEFDALKTIEDANPEATANTMVKDLANDQQRMIQSLESCLEAAEAIDDQVTAGMMTDRMGSHEKTAWMLRSSL